MCSSLVDKDVVEDPILMASGVSFHTRALSTIPSP